jgi:hypothetical protein
MGTNRNVIYNSWARQFKQYKMQTAKYYFLYYPNQSLLMCKPWLIFTGMSTTKVQVISIQEHPKNLHVVTLAAKVWTVVFSVYYFHTILYLLY